MVDCVETILRPFPMALRKSAVALPCLRNILFQCRDLSALLKFHFSIKTRSVCLSFQPPFLAAVAVLLSDVMACLCLSVAASLPSPALNHDKSLLNADNFLIPSSLR